jgi:hypothetical protein
MTEPSFETLKAEWAQAVAQQALACAPLPGKALRASVAIVPTRGDQGRRAAIRLR